MNNEQTQRNGVETRALCADIIALYRANQARPNVIQPKTANALQVSDGIVYDQFGRKSESVRAKMARLGI